MNPANLSAALSRLFPPGAIAADLREPGDPELLLPAEAKCLGRAVVPMRAQEFAAGRLCARRALAEFGIVDFPLEAAGDRQPIWPGSVVGSITHSAGFCAAVVAERRRAAALGLDSEVIGDVKVELWARICVSFEIDWIRSLPAAQQALAATLIFSAKEAFYKCQYPLVHERLGFHDVTLEVVSWGTPGGIFRIHAARKIALQAHVTKPVEGRYLFHEGLVTAGIGLAA